MQAEEPKKQDPAQSTSGKKEGLEVQKLSLEVQELKEKLTRRGKIARLIPIIAPSVTLLGLIIGASVTLLNEGKRHRLEAITNLKRELASTNDAVRTSAVHALADYPKEGIPTLIACLGSTELTGSQPEEDTAFTSAVKASLRQIGKKAVYPLIDELRRTQGEINNALRPESSARLENLPQGLTFPDWLKDRMRYDESAKLLIFKGVMSEHERDKISRLSPVESYKDAVKALFESSIFYNSLPFSIFSEFDRGREAVGLRLRAIAKLNSLNISNEEITRCEWILDSIRSSRYEAVVANKNGTEVLANLLRKHTIRKLDLERIDLSGASLFEAKLPGAYLAQANLSGTILEEANLPGANLGDANLSGAILFKANLSGAYLEEANLAGAILFEANLSGTILEEANLDKVQGFWRVIDFRKTDLRGVKGLSRKDLDYAKSRGAIIDESTVKEAPTEAQKQGQ